MTLFEPPSQVDLKSEISLDFSDRRANTIPLFLKPVWVGFLSLATKSDYLSWDSGDSYVSSLENSLLQILNQEEKRQCGGAELGPE